MAVISRSHTFKEIRYKAAREALTGIKVGVVARKYDVSPKTIRNWVKGYQETFGADAIPSIDEQLDEARRVAELEEKLDLALKALGEKEIENNILRELLKKSKSLSMTGSTSLRRSSIRE
jgi:Transposase.